eukprot:CAMPEP_0174927548 /NCGR_PEP_ID=MMETSP1355-20121228/18594_1 /TAXON_ID=464990 /ORGANISM="Hemiselmis tepida, Strain CCMP443" /LENGTH=296 /DNA_ID=CAMNT_0016173657 /DNA_START=11 /DNA_END=897 /DNA_ORIENTATION=-
MASVLGTPGETANKRAMEATQAAALAEAQSLSQEMRDKFVKKNHEFKASQEAARKNEERLKKEIDDVRSKLSRSQEDASTAAQTLKMQRMEEAERYEREIEQLKDHNNKLLNDMDSALRSVPDKLKVDSDRLRSAKAEVERSLEVKDKELATTLKKTAEGKDRALGLQKEQYEFWLAKKNEELRAFGEDFAAYKAEKTSQLNAMEKQVLYLFDYCNTLATMIQNFERGLYPVYEKSGVKSAQFPDKSKPGPMPAELLRDLQKYKKRAEDFARAHPTAITSASLGRMVSSAGLQGAG